jgi:hypothetical protein
MFLILKFFIFLEVLFEELGMFGDKKLFFWWVSIFLRYG